MNDTAPLARAALWPLRHPRVTVLVALVLTLVAALAWPRVVFEPDVSRLLPADHPHVRIADLLDERARPSRSLWVLLRGETAAARLPALVEALRASPLVAEVAATRAELLGSAAAAARAPLWALGDDELAQLADAVAPAGRARAIAALREDLADDPLAARELAVRDPLALRWLFAEHDLARQLGLRGDTDYAVFADGSAVLRLAGTKDAYDPDFAVALLAHVDSVLAGVDHELFGGYAVARADQARIRADFERASVWSLAAIAAYLIWAMRGLRLPLLVQLPATLSIVWAVPFACLLLGPLPTVAVAAVAVLGGLGVDFAIHYAARYRHARRTAGHADAVRAVQVHTVPELLIDMATTAVTFAALGFGQRGGLATFGWLLALGLVASVLLTTTVLPVLLRFAGERRDPERSAIAALADRWLAHRAARPAAWAAVGLAAVAAAVVLALGVPVRADGEALRPADDPIARARDHVEATLGFATVPVIVLWPAARDASPLWQALDEQRTAGVVRFWSGLDRAMTDAGRAAVAAFRERSAGFTAAARAELSAAGFAVDAFGPALDELAADFARDPEPVAPATIELAGGVQRVITVWPAARVDRASFATLADTLRARAGEAVTTHGSPTVASALEDVLRADLQRAVALAAVLAAAMVGLWLRSWRAGLLALLPSAIGLAATLGVLVLTGAPLTMVSFVAVPFVLGIGVDEGVHMVGHFRERALTTGATGVGVVRTSIGTALGFLALVLADSPGLVQLGALVAAGSCASMLACLFVLAPLLARRASAT